MTDLNEAASNLRAGESTGAWDAAVAELEGAVRAMHGASDGALTGAVTVGSLRLVLAALWRTGAALHECAWAREADMDMPDTWDGACGAKWSFIEGGPLENKLRFCPECGGKVVLEAADHQEAQEDG